MATDSKTILDAEKLILSAAFEGPQQFQQLQDAGITEKTFTIPYHASIWGVFAKKSHLEGAFDVLAVQHALEAQNAALRGYEDGIQSLTEIATYGAYVRFRTGSAVELVLEEEKKREIGAFGTFASSLANEAEKTAEEVLECLEKRMSQLRTNCGVKNEESITNIISEIVENLQHRITHPGTIRGISSGFSRLDMTLDGLQPGAMIVLAARPGVGKTAGLVNILTNLCLAGHPVGMFSLEMPTSQLLERVLYGMAKINMDDIRRGKGLTGAQIKDFKTAVSMINNAPIFIDDESALTINKIKARARRMVKEHDVKIIGIDYIQLIRSTSTQSKNSREREVSEISAGLKAIAKELNIPVLVLAQLNRNVENRTGKAQGKPVVADLRESGSIEQDADQIILIHRPGMYDPNISINDAQWIVGKNRFGRTGIIPFRWEPEYTQYTEQQQTTNY